MCTQKCKPYDPGLWINPSLPNCDYEIVYRHQHCLTLGVKVTTTGGIRQVIRNLLLSLLPYPFDQISHTGRSRDRVIQNTVLPRSIRHLAGMLLGCIQTNVTWLPFSG